MIVPGAGSNVVIRGHSLPVPVILIVGCLILFSLFSAISWQDHEEPQTLTRTGHGLSSTGTVHFARHPLEALYHHDIQ